MWDKQELLKTCKNVPLAVGGAGVWSSPLSMQSGMYEKEISNYINMDWRWPFYWPWALREPINHVGGGGHKTHSHKIQENWCRVSKWRINITRTNSYHSQRFQNVTFAHGTSSMVEQPWIDACLVKQMPIKQCFYSSRYCIMRAIAVHPFPG